MGLKFKLFIIMCKVTMSVLFNLGVPPPAAASRTVPAAPPAPASACKHGNRCWGCTACGKTPKKGKGGAATLTQEQVAAQKAEAEARAAEARARTLRSQADAAEAEARLKAAQSTAVVASTPRAKPGATSGGGDFVTREEFIQFRGEVNTGFSSVFKQNEQTHAVLAGFVTMMNGGGLPAPVSRQIGNGRAQEVPEPQRQISYGQNAGWDPAAEKLDRSITSSSQRPQSGAACGGGSAQEFHRESVQSPATFATAGMSKFDEAVKKWNTNPKNSKNNGRIIGVIQRSTTDVDMQCMLLALANGKTYSEIVKMYGDDVASLLSTRNTPFFQSFFTALTKCGVPANFDVKVDASKTKSGYGFVMTYLQLSQAPGNVDNLVTFLRSE
jgi:hypothetical protein